MNQSLNLVATMNQIFCLSSSYWRKLEGNECPGLINIIFKEPKYVIFWKFSIDISEIRVSSLEKEINLA